MSNYLNISPIKYLSDAQIETQAENDFILYQKRLGHNVEFPLYPEEIARVLWGIEIEYPENVVDDEGAPVLACFIPSEKKIRLNTSLDTNKGRTSFSVAHEVGHVSLHDFLVDFTPDGVRSFCYSQGGRSPDQDAKQVERQADKYASYLLMPRHEVNKALEKYRIRHDNPLDLALHGKTLRDHFAVSFYALEIRLAELAVEVKNPRYPQRTKKLPKAYGSDIERGQWAFKEEVAQEDNWSRA